MNIRSRGRRRRTGLLLLMAIVALLAACGTGGSASVAPSGAAQGPAEAAAPAGGEQLEGEAEGEDNAGTGNPGAPVDGPLVVKTGTLQLEVEQLDATVLAARGEIRRFGGYVSASEQSTSGDSAIASITYRIPAERWDDAIDTLRKLASRVVNEETSTDEVTAQVVDLDARIRNLQASERTLQAYLARATKISELLEVQAQLTGVREQIERFTAQKENLADQAAYGTLSVLFTVPPAVAVETAKSWNPGAEVDRAVAQAVALGQALASALIWFAIVLLPVLLFGALLVGLGLFLVRRVPRGYAERSGPAG